MRMLAELEDVARLERTRLADAVHDDALQLLAVARQDLLEWMEDSPERQALADRLDETRRALRAIVASLDEATLDDLPLRPSLERLAGAVAGRARFAVTVETDGEVDGVHDAAVRGWVRELLANAAKHASAENVGVLVRATPDALEVIVRDDGDGFDEASRRRSTEDGHLGLRRLERTARLLGGGFTIGPEAGGTVARVVMPRAALVAQRRIEDELGAERRWSAGLVAALRDALLVVREGRVVQVNEALRTMTGHSSAELLGAAVPDLPFWAVGDRTANARRFTHAVALGGDAVLRMTRADGTGFNARWSTQRVDDGLGGGVGSLVLIRDLTAEEQALERAQLRTELGTTIETTRRLARMLGAARRSSGEMYSALGDLLTHHLGWSDVVLNVRRGDGWVVEWTSDGEAAALLGERYDADAFRPFLDPLFDRGGVFHSLEEDRVPVPGLTIVIGPRETSEPGSVRPDDTLLVPVDDSRGRTRAMISVDRPRTGRRPTPTQLQALAAVASHVGLAFELLDPA